MFSSPSVPGKNQGLHVALTGCRADFDIHNADKDKIIYERVEVSTTYAKHLADEVNE